MSMMQATAIISARDLASGVFARVAANARAASGRYSSAVGTFAAASNKMHGALAIAAPTALGLGAFGHDQYEWDRAVHQYRAIAEIAPEAFAKVESAIIKTSNSLGINKMELLDAAKGWQQLGNSPETFIKNVQFAAEASRITGIAIDEQMSESSALMRAWGANVNDPSQYKHYEEVYTVASKGMKGGAHAFGEAMQSWAPIASDLGITMEEAAAFTQTLGGQFDPSAIGNALKTGFLRLANPVPKSEAMLRSAGVDRAKLFNYDPKKVGDADALIRNLKGSGSFSVTPAVERMIRRDLANVDLSHGADKLTDKLNEDLSHAMGGKKMSAQDRKILQASILSHMSEAATGLNPEEFFKVFGPLSHNLAFMSQVFGKEHAAKFIDLLKQYERYSANYKNIVDHAEGALERKTSIFGEGFAFQWDRVKTGIDNLMNSVGGSGIRSDMEGVFKSIADAFDASQNANPQTLRTLFWGLAGVAALAPAGYVLSGIASSLSMIGAIAGSPIVITIAGAYLLYDVYKKWDQLTKAKDKISFVVDLVLNDMLPGWAKTLIESGAESLNQGAFDNQLQNKTHGGRWARLQDWMAGRSHLETHSPFGSDASSPLRLLDLSAQHVNVTGSAEVRVQSDVRVKVDGPGTVTDQRSSGGQATVPLNTGKGMPDTGFRPRGH